MQFERNGAGYFPPGADYTDYDYTADLYTETTDAGSMYNLQDKTVWVRVEDREDRRVLNDKIKMRACMVVGKATWPEFGNLLIELTEEGHEYTDAEAKYNDPYSVALARSGPRTLMTLKYHYNEKKKRFERVE